MSDGLLHQILARLTGIEARLGAVESGITSRLWLAELPSWPRFLSHDEAARYVGVSKDVFDLEVRQGIWPPALRRGARGGRLTWDRVSLDKAADRAAGVEGVAEPGATGPAVPKADAAYWLKRIDATSARKRTRSRQ